MTAILFLAGLNPHEISPEPRDGGEESSSHPPEREMQDQGCVGLNPIAGQHIGLFRARLDPLGHFAQAALLPESCPEAASLHLNTGPGREALAFSGPASRIEGSGTRTGPRP